ncbi:dienelactone hydrolase family protein [Actinomadura sp. KC216]|uniref:dienelactone hydrolase family protein n=1 Tax=Actinomadura sp. KC216 TaxID=2530370 RepID=UPI001AA00C9B|nr:dienelactone hydrolase family protein [Actinomadura sp. KC216]
MGHCSGGRHAFLAACSLDLDAAVDCYGAFVASDPPDDYPMTTVARSIISKAPDLSCPLLGLFGEDDRFPAPDEVAALDAGRRPPGPRRSGARARADAGQPPAWAFFSAAMSSLPWVASIASVARFAFSGSGSPTSS